MNKPVGTVSFFPEGREIDALSEEPDIAMNRFAM